MSKNIKYQMETREIKNWLLLWKNCEEKPNQIGDVDDNSKEENNKITEFNLLNYPKGRITEKELNEIGEHINTQMYECTWFKVNKKLEQH